MLRLYEQLQTAHDIALRTAILPRYEPQVTRKQYNTALDLIKQLWLHADPAVVEVLSPEQRELLYQCLGNLLDGPK